MNKEKFKELILNTKFGRMQNQMQISALKSKLAATDYQALKFVEGHISIEDYKPIKLQRQAMRDEINLLEATQDN